jgi:CRP-like cAMP-binding protein
MRFQKGDTILQEGQVSRYLYFVEKGMVRQYYYKNSKDVTEHFSFEGRIVFCIESFLKQEPSRLIVEALENTKLYAIPYDDLNNLLARNQEIDMLYRKILEHVAISSQEHADSQRFENATERYERLLREKPEIILRAPMIHIASFLQMTPETLSRVRNGTLQSAPRQHPSPKDQNDAWWTHATK